ncbi:MAG TPA: hypothetical protein VJA44_07840 [Acidimicrobiia bacterium]|nr:hypothetical protein [Acidimicrobiia bacterium]
MSDWVVVVDWVPLLEAEPLFREWLRSHDLAEDDLDLEALWVDTGRGSGTDLRRYRVTRAELERLKIDPKARP